MQIETLDMCEGRGNSYGMLKPSDVAVVPESNQDLLQMSEIEKYIDSRIEAATEFPLVLGHTRSGWKPENVLKVANRFREAGWIVYYGGSFDPDVLLRIDHPGRLGR